MAAPDLASTIRALLNYSVSPAEVSAALINAISQGSGGGTSFTPLTLNVPDNSNAITVNDVGPIVDGVTAVFIEHAGNPIGWFGSGLASSSATGTVVGDITVATIGTANLIRFNNGLAQTTYEINGVGPSANFQTPIPNIVNFIGSSDTSTGTGMLWLQAGGGSDTYGGTIAMFGGSSTTNPGGFGAGGGVWIGTANHGSGTIAFGLGGNPTAVDAVYGYFLHGGGLRIQAPTTSIPAFISNAAANAYAIEGFGSSTSGQSFGMALEAGSTSADFCAEFVNAAGSINFALFRGDGAVYFPDIGTTATAANTTLVAGTFANQILKFSSSLRYKANVQSIGAADIDAVMRMRPVQYTSTCAADDPTVLHLGFIAEEMAAIDPRLVFYTPGQWQTVPKPVGNGVDIVPVPGTLVPDGVQYTQLTALLVGAVQALVQRVAALEGGKPMAPAGPVTPGVTAPSVTLGGAAGLTGTAVFTGTPAPIVVAPLAAAA